MDGKEKLNSSQSKTLEEFILEFLPRKGNKRKSSKNEIEYVCPTLKRIFSKYFNFRIETVQILKAFKELHYSIFIKNNKWDSEKKEIIPADELKDPNLEEIFKNRGDCFIYINIEPSAVRQLRLITSGLNPTSNKEKLIKKEAMIKRIEMFKQKMDKNS